MNWGAEAAAAERRRNGRLAGVLLIVGALTATPAAFLVEPTPVAIAPLVAVALVAGLAGITAPWQRLPDATLSVFPIVGTILIAGTVVFVDETYAFLYFIVAVYVAFVFRRRTELFGHLALVVVAIFAPLLYEPDLLRRHLRLALLATPSMIITVTAVRYLRRSLEERERAQREFAREAIAIAQRLRGPATAPVAEERLAELGRELSRRD